VICIKLEKYCFGGVVNIAFTYGKDDMDIAFNRTET